MLGNFFSKNLKKCLTFVVRFGTITIVVGNTLPRDNRIVKLFFKMKLLSNCCQKGF